MPTVRSAPVVSVYARHRASCSHASRREFYRGCQCPKWLRYSRKPTKQSIVATKTCFYLARFSPRPIAPDLCSPRETGPQDEPKAAIPGDATLQGRDRCSHAIACSGTRGNHQAGYTKPTLESVHAGVCRQRRRDRNSRRQHKEAELNGRTTGSRSWLKPSGARQATSQGFATNSMT
jgi:hypothetical protein